MTWCAPLDYKHNSSPERMAKSDMCSLHRNYKIAVMAVVACFIMGMGLALEESLDRYPLSPAWEVYSPHVYPPSATYVSDYQQGVTVWSKAAILMDASTATVLFGKNEHQRRDPASTTKVMTAILALELGRPDDIVTVSSRAAWTHGSSLNLRPGDRLPLSELLKGMLMCSGNDGSVAIAEHIAGTESRFAEMMTVRAQQIGAPNSSFRNPHGLTAVNHYSTAYDLAMMTKHALMYPQFRSIIATSSDVMRYEDGRVQEIHNTNRLLSSFYGADGVKTGTTSAAGQCLIASATRDSWQLIAVVLGSSSRWSDAQRLLEYGFSSFVRRQLAKGGAPVTEVPIIGGRDNEVTVIADSDLLITVRREHENRIELHMELPSSVKAPIKRGSKLGELVAQVDGSDIGSVNLVAEHSVARRGLVGLILDRF